MEVVVPGGDSGPFTLATHVSETQPDESPVQPAAPGDISLAVASITLVPVGPEGSVAGACTPVGVSGSGYDAVLTITCSFAAVSVNTYSVEVTVNGGYYEGFGEDVVVVFDPSLGFTTGGGWFYWPGTVDPSTGYLGDRTNFGYTMKYGRRRTRIKGSLLLIRVMSNYSIVTNEAALRGIEAIPRRKGS